jgi:7-cyano-7-deazaguanine synthase in queuosine biosynthesis
MNASGLIVVRASFPGENFRPRKGQLVCRIPEDVWLLPEEIEAFCFKRIGSRDEELIYLAGVVAYIDRRVRRHIGIWHRCFNVIMPVSEPRFWRQPAVSSALVEALQFLTGDTWTFEFIKRQGRLPRFNQNFLDIGGGDFVVIPFSNGLDSFAQSRLLETQGFSGTPIRVTAWNRGLTGSRDWLTDPNGARYRRVAVPVRIAEHSSPEPTYRTRTFLFSVLAGLAAYLAGAKTIVIPEGGQGALGPSLVPVGSESPQRGSHPGFSRRMEVLFRGFWGEPVMIRQPQIWRTKGQVLAEVCRRGFHAGWERTRSCPRGPRDLRSGRSCGICSGCLLRRVAVFAAGLEESEDHYLWSNLRADTLEESLCAEAKRTTSVNDRDIAVHAVLGMEELARQADLPITHPRHQQVLFDVFGNDTTQLKTGAEQLAQLLTVHKNEWRTFTAFLGSRAWINQQIVLLTP